MRANGTAPRKKAYAKDRKLFRFCKTAAVVLSPLAYIWTMNTIAEAPGPANRLTDRSPAAATRIRGSSLGEGIKLLVIAVIVLALLVKFKLMALVKRAPGR
jgi:hypothetical protein